MKRILITVWLARSISGRRRKVLLCGLASILLAGGPVAAQSTPASIFLLSANSKWNDVVGIVIPTQNGVWARSYMPALRGFMSGIAKAFTMHKAERSIATLDAVGRLPSAQTPSSLLLTALTFSPISQGSFGDGSEFLAQFPTISGPSTTFEQITGAVYSLVQEGRWGASQADNDSIFAAALAFSANANVDGITIDVPMGTQRLTVPQSITTTKPFKLRCAGRGNSRIIVDTGAQSLLTITQQTVGAQVNIEGCEFVAASPGVAVPIVIRYVGTPQGPSPYAQYSSVVLRDLSFVGLGNTAKAGVNYFLNGIDITNAWQPILSGIHFTGAIQNRRGAQNAVTFRYSFAMQVHDIFAQYAVRGIYDPGGATNGQNSEGLSVHSGELVDVDTGIELIGTDSDPGLFIGPMHINAGKSCVRTVYKSQIDISRLLCYKLAGDTNDFNGLDIVNASYGYINQIQIGDSRNSNGGGAFTGIKLTASYGVTLNGVQAQGWQNNTGSLVQIAGKTDATRLNNVDASLVSGLNPVGFDAGAGVTNRFVNVQPAVTQGLTVNSVTPSVGNDRSGLFTTANTSATSITNFANGYTGQKITVFFQDAVTTLMHGAPLRLKGATNVRPPPGGSISATYLGAYWIETSRSF